MSDLNENEIEYVREWGPHISYRALGPYVERLLEEVMRRRSASEDKFARAIEDAWVISAYLDGPHDVKVAVRMLIDDALKAREVHTPLPRPDQADLLERLRSLTREKAHEQTDKGVRARDTGESKAPGFSTLYGGASGGDQRCANGDSQGDSQGPDSTPSKIMGPWPDGVLRGAIERALKECWVSSEADKILRDALNHTVSPTNETQEAESALNEIWRGNTKWIDIFLRVKNRADEAEKKLKELLSRTEEIKKV